MKRFFRKIKATVRLFIKHKVYLNGKASYYPNAPHKTKVEVFMDQLTFIWKYGDVERFYYAYGFDRKSMPRKKVMNEYIINENAFLKKVDYRNNHINKKIGRFSGRAILSDKFYFYLFLNSLNIPTPKILFYTRNGKLFYSSCNLHHEKSGINDIFGVDYDGFAKPFGGQCGNGAFAIKTAGKAVYVNNQLLTQTDDLLQVFKKTNYIIQERVVQHSQLNKLCSTAVNTIRLITLITSDEDIIAVRAGLRIGREGCNVDNCAKGGIFVGIDMNTGKLMKEGIIKPPHGKLVHQHPDSKIIFEGFEIPFFKEAVEMAKELHSKLYRIHSVGWDIAITQDGPMFIEGNSKWEISGTQAAVGGVKFIEKYFN